MQNLYSDDCLIANKNTSQVDAAIVRIMKTRKVLSHTLLITELFQQVNNLSLFFFSTPEEWQVEFCMDFRRHLAKE